MFNHSHIQFDATGRALTGERRYTITFKPPIRYSEAIAPGFWSMTMYDGTTKLSVENPIDRYSLGSDNDLKQNPDGSFTLYLQADTPGPDNEANWLPAPKGPFYLLLLLRNYAPVPEAVEIEDSAKSGYYHRQADLCLRMALLASDYEERLRLLDIANGYRDDAVGVEALRGRESPDVDQWLLTNLDL